MRTGGVPHVQCTWTNTTNTCMTWCIAVVVVVVGVAVDGGGGVDVPRDVLGSIVLPVLSVLVGPVDTVVAVWNWRRPRPERKTCPCGWGVGTLQPLVRCCSLLAVLDVACCFSFVCFSLG